MRSTSFQFECQNDFIVCREKINEEKKTGFYMDLCGKHLLFNYMKNFAGI